ncbi:hypothetical protein RB195_009130 [Necator americanus]|uniref:Uncharacterized protein n=1 Tax=Necator americanus TaxID=51031 RepID=A0ABR1CTC6_NECAM
MEEFEKAHEDTNARKAYALLKKYSGKMKRCSPVLNTPSGVAVGEATLPINPSTKSEVVARIQKNRESGGGDEISNC